MPAAWLTALALAGATPTALPPYTPAYEPTSVDERGLWMEADEDERILRDSPLLVRDEALRGYVKSVLCRTVGEDRCKGVRIYIVEVPAFNASMMPNGTMRVFTGLLLRVRSEAELASVLGHEFAHFELRHGLKDFKHARTATDIMAWVSVLGGLSGTNTDMTQFALLGSIFHFSREQEQEADLLGLKYLTASPYPAASAANVWTNLMAEEDATKAGRNRKSRHPYTAGFFATHPTERTRAAYLTTAALAVNDPGDARVASYREALAGEMPKLLAAQIKLNDFGGSDYLIGEMARSIGWTKDLLFARAELYRDRGNPRDLETAATLYQSALDAGLAAPTAYRGLGLSLMRSGRSTDGAAALRRYLEQSPGAADASAIRMLIP